MKRQVRGFDPDKFASVVAEIRDRSASLGERLAKLDFLLDAPGWFSAWQREAIQLIEADLAVELAGAGEARAFRLVYTPGPKGTIVRSLPT